MTEATTHITTSGGLISAAFIRNIREPGSRRRGIELTSFAWLPFVWYNCLVRRNTGYER